MKTWKRRASTGHSLIELAVAVVVAGVGLTATAASVVSGAKLSQTNASLRSCTRAATTMMERVRATPFASIASTYSGQYTSFRDLGEAGSNGQVRCIATPISTGSSRWYVYQINVTARTSGPGGAVGTTMTTYVADRTTGTAFSGGGGN